MSNKIISFIFALIIVISLVGCNSLESSTGISKETQKTTQSTTATSVTSSTTAELVQNESSMSYDLMYFAYPEDNLYNPKFPRYDTEQHYDSYDFVPPETLEIAIGEKNYTLLYERTSINRYSEPSQRRHKYRDNNNNGFSFDGKGNLVSVYGNSTVYPEIGIDYQEDAILSQEECEKKAKDFLSLLVDISNYKIVSVYEAEYPKKTACYVVFTKYFGEIPAYETVRVQVRYDGYILGFSSTNFKGVPDNITIPNIDPDKLDTTIQIFKYATYNASMNKAKVTLEPSLFVLHDGEVALIFECTFHDDDPDNPLDIGEYYKNLLIIKLPQT